MIEANTHKGSSENPIRVLFISSGCHLQDFTGQMEYVAWCEGALASFCGNRVRVGIAFGCDDGQTSSPSCETAIPADSDIAYFPLNVNMNYGAIGKEWELARRALLDVIDRFEPDIIQCYGSELPYGAIAEYVDIPVVIHMMGFLNIYYLSIDMAHGHTYEKPIRRKMKRVLSFVKLNPFDVRTICEKRATFERRVMVANRYFMGRTDWDKNIVKFYSPGSHYYHVPEFIHYPFIREAGTWKYHFDGKLRLLTVSSADDRKGIEIILQTAKLLKDLIGIDFEWRIAGNTEFFELFERRSGIRHEGVNVRLLGMLEKESIVDELKGADLFIHPSIIDNSPRAICEAQLVGCPVIASNVGGVPQLVENGATGFLYPYNEPHTLAFLIANLIEQRNVLTDVSDSASRTARERHDPERIANRVLDVYKEILATHEK